MSCVFSSVSTRDSPQGLLRVKTLKIKAYKQKVGEGESIDTVNASRLDLRLANRLNYSGIQTFGVLGSVCSRESDRPTSMRSEAV